MPRRLRCNSGGYVYHALNRGVGRATLFHKDGDYTAFEKALRQALEWRPVRLLGYCLLPNHWHLVLWPQADGDLSEFLRWLTVTHTQRWHAHYHTSGTGPLYQGRFKSFPVAEDEHLFTVLRYVERNALRAGLVGRAEAWRWSSLWRRVEGEVQGWLHDGPVPLPADWAARVNEPQTEAELEAVRRSVERGCPFGEAGWVERTAKRLGLEATLRRQGRPRKTASREPGARNLFGVRCPFLLDWRAALDEHAGMGRALRLMVGGLVYHVFNRANRRVVLFSGPGDYAAFRRVLAEGQRLHPVRLLSYCQMPNHWHLGSDSLAGLGGSRPLHRVRHARLPPGRQLPLGVLITDDGGASDEAAATATRHARLRRPPQRPPVRDHTRDASRRTRLPGWLLLPRLNRGNARRTVFHEERGHGFFLPDPFVAALRCVAQRPHPHNATQRNSRGPLWWPKRCVRTRFLWGHGRQMHFPEARCDAPGRSIRRETQRGGHTWKPKGVIPGRKTKADIPES